MTANPEDDPEPGRPQAVQQATREERLAQSLRANLQKRKDQARQRQTKTDPGKVDPALE